MPEKYHIETKAIPPRRPRVGKFGVIDWREDCARCHNCVKKACVYDRYREEAQYVRTLEAVDALFFECMGCFSCIQNCTKGLLRLSVNPVWEGLGNEYWTPGIIQTTWAQAETAKIPVSGAGYRGPFSGPGFDSMWTDMSEIVRPTRDGIHGREYISTAVDIGRKPAYLSFNGKSFRIDAACLSIQMPLILDVQSSRHMLPKLGPAIRETARRTDTIAMVRPSELPFLNEDVDRVLPHVAFCLSPEEPVVPPEALARTRLVETYDGPDVTSRIKRLKDKHPNIVVSVRVPLDANGIDRAVELACMPEVEVIHVLADANGNEIGVAEAPVRQGHDPPDSHDADRKRHARRNHADRRRRHRPGRAHGQGDHLRRGSDQHRPAADDRSGVPSVRSAASRACRVRPGSKMFPLITPPDA